MIDEAVLIEAARGHIESLAAGIDLVLRAQRVEPTDLQSCLAALYDTRMEGGAIPDSPRAAYLGGAIDGFLLGVKAARAAGMSEEDAERAMAQALSERLVDEVERLRWALAEYAEHQSWRCGHPDMYPHDPDCPCGLVGDMRKLGIPLSTPPTTERGGEGALRKRRHDA